MLENVSDTARWVAVYRAMETERPDAIFRDDFARRLAGERGEQIMRSMRRGKSAAWAMIVRTAVMDEIILQTIAREHVDLVINLAAGLDARPWRLDIPPTLSWIDVDFAPILEYKQQIIGDAPPRCRYRAEYVDLREADRRRTLFEQLDRECSHALIISEGLLIYLSPDNVGGLARDIHASSHFRFWLTDLGSPRLLRIMNRTWGKRAAQANAEFRFAPAEGTKFFEKLGWKTLIQRYSLLEAQRLKREMPLAGLWRTVMKLFPAKTSHELQTMASVVLLERMD